MFISLVCSLVGHRQTPTKLKTDIMQMGMICLPGLFRTMTIKDSIALAGVAQLFGALSYNPKG